MMAKSRVQHKIINSSQRNIEHNNGGEIKHNIMCTNIVDNNIYK